MAITLAIGAATDADSALAAESGVGEAPVPFVISRVRDRPMPLTVVIGGRDLTKTHAGLTFSNSDPGGFEVLNLNPKDLDGIRPGERATVRVGLETAWDGRVNEPGEHATGRRSEFSVAALGYGAALKDNPIRQIFVDQDKGKWGGASVQRRINLLGSNLFMQDASMVPDDTTGFPSLNTKIAGAWTVGQLPIVEPVYNALGLPIDSLYYAWKKNSQVDPADTHWSWSALLADDDVFSSSDSSGELKAAGPGSGTLQTTRGSRTFAALQFLYSAAAGGSDNADFSLFWTALAVYGAHGLTKRGQGSSSIAPGFYPSDIAAWAMKASGAHILPGVVQDAVGYIVAHSVYTDPTNADQVVDDMAKLVGWHWGVWEPALLESTPRWWFSAPPEDATCFVSKGDCEDLVVPKVRLDLLYDTAQVAYSDTLGVARIATVRIANPLLADAGVEHRTLPLSMGVATADTATAFGKFALLLSQRAARGSGSATLQTVRDANGELRPACLLKAGRDRLRIIDLPDSGPLTAAQAARYDSFHVKRVETTVSPDGRMATNVEFDGGGDLLEVLQARLAITATLVGGG